MTPDNQRAVSDLLRSADKSIKEGNLDNALASIVKVFEFDPRNVYARAYQERIISLKEAKIIAHANADKLATDHSRKTQEQIAQHSKPAPPPALEQPART